MSKYTKQESFYLPFVLPLLEKLTASGELIFAIDGSTSGSACMVLMVSVIYKKRAIPIIWIARKGKKGHLMESLHCQLIHYGRQKTEKPFFAYVAFTPPHDPRSPKKEYHGLAMGSHVLLGKQNLYDHSMKAPLIFYGRGIPKGNTSEALVYLYDIFPTLCSLANIGLPQGLDGKDLSGIIKGETSSVMSSLFTTYKKTQRAVRDQRCKFIRYPELDYTQLFNLQHDPYELNNLVGLLDFQSKMKEMTQLLKTWQQTSDNALPLIADTLKPMEYDPTKFKRKPDQHQPKYILNKYFKDTE